MKEFCINRHSQGNSKDKRDLRKMTCRITRKKLTHQDRSDVFISQKVTLVFCFHLSLEKITRKLEIVQYKFFRARTFYRGCKICRILERNNGHHNSIIFLGRNEEKEREGNIICEARFRNSHARGGRWRVQLTYNINEAILVFKKYVLPV